MYQLRVAGAPECRITKPSWPVLTKQAVDLARQGYQVNIIDTERPARGVEVYRSKHGLHVRIFNNTDIAEELLPGWIETARADLHRIIERTP